MSSLGLIIMIDQSETVISFYWASWMIYRGHIYKPRTGSLALFDCHAKYSVQVILLLGMDSGNALTYINK
jgi:hypothetical protein